MNNPNPFLPRGSFLEQKNKARTRLKIAVYFSISLSVLVLMGLLIQGCKKPSEDAANPSGQSGTETNAGMPQLPTNPPDMGAVSNTPPPPDTNPPAPLPPLPQPTPQAPPPPVATTEDYTVVKGDTLASIATHNHITTKAMMNANPGVDPKKLKIGQKLHLPSAASASAAPVPATMGATETPAAGSEQTYKVKSNDNLTSIAKHFHVKIKAIQSANNLTTTSIKVGQVLKIPGASAPAPAPVETLPPPSLSAPAPAPVITAPHAAH